jgi:CRISPR-associated protein Cas2
MSFENQPDKFRMIYGGVRNMWVVAMFDLPVETSEMRSCYRKFREFLLNDGFMMMQYSVYARFCPNRENAETHSNRIESKVPEDGQVRVFTLTELQFQKMKIFSGNSRKPPEDAPDQLSFW